MADLQKQINDVLALVTTYGGIDGNHHKEWVIDQMVRTLCGSEEKYKEWVSNYEHDEDDTYEWSIDIAP